MRIEIDHKRINNSPYGQIIRDTSNPDLDQLEKDLIHGNNTSVLVSGYRGAGKTSLICQLNHRLNKYEKTLFICIEISKYENYSMILRKIIRAIYWNLNAKDGKKKKDSLKDDLVKRIDELYIRTFNDVTHNTDITKKTEKETGIVSTFDVKKIAEKTVPLLAALILGINYKSNIISKYNTPLFIFTILFIFFENMGLTLKRTRNSNTTDKDEIIMKTLYDDEIAEQHVKTLLKDLMDQGFRTIITLDEIDKIEDQKSIENIISELKPVMLSDTASFIIVCGQNLYYKYASSNTIDDSLISSVFAKTVHVRLLNIESFKKVFKSLIINEKELNGDIVELYTDSLILNSNRIVRRFLNNISKNIRWDGDTAYIETADSGKCYESDSRYLKIITDEGNPLYKIISNTDPGFKDFFIVQLHIWIQKIKQKGCGEFKKEDILSIDNDYKEECLKNCLYDLERLFQELIDVLLSERILSRKAVKVSELDDLVFRAVDEDENLPDAILKNIRMRRRDFLTYVDTVEKTVETIFNELNKNRKDLFGNIYDSSAISINEKASLLKSIEVLGNEIHLDFKTVLEAKEYLNMSAMITKMDMEIIEYHDRPNLQKSLIESYIYYLVKDFLQDDFIIERADYFSFIARKEDAEVYLFYLLNYEDIKIRDDAWLSSITEVFRRSRTPSHGHPKTLIVFIWGVATASEVENLYDRIRRNDDKNLNIYMIPVFVPQKTDTFHEIHSLLQKLSKERL